MDRVGDYLNLAFQRGNTSIEVGKPGVVNDMRDGEQLYDHKNRLVVIYFVRYSRLK